MELVTVGQHSDMCTIVHAISAVFIGFNAILVTWLTLRAKRKDREHSGRFRRYR